MMPAPHFRSCVPSARLAPWCLSMLFYMLLSGAASADGGSVRLQESAGPFRITVFTAPEPLRAGRADLSVLVQEREGGEPILDADVAVRLAAPVLSGGDEITAAATHAQAINKLLYAAATDLPVPGTWNLRVGVRQGTRVADVGTDLVVAPRGTGVGAVWPYVLVPPTVIVLFVLHQWRVHARANTKSQSLWLAVDSR